MNRTPPTAITDDAMLAVWRDSHDYLVRLATRVLRDPTEAEDVVQDAFDCLARMPLDDIVDVRGWLAVVVRRVCLDRLKSAHARREAASADVGIDDLVPLHGQSTGDPLDRVTLDDQVQLALALVLDRLTPAERTAFVLHDVFGFPFDAVAEIVGRTPAACRQLASRARRSMRSGTTPARRTEPEADHEELVERFIAACAGGDLDALMTLLDPDVGGDAVLVGHGPIVHLEGPAAVAQRLLVLFGPSGTRVMVPVPLERGAGVAVFGPHGVHAFVRMAITGQRVRQFNAYVLPPR